MEHTLTQKTVEYSGSVRMERPIDTTVHLDLLMTKKAEDVVGLTKWQSAVVMLSLWMRKDQSSSVPHREQQEYSPSMLTLQIAGSTSCASGVCQENTDVH